MLFDKNSITESLKKELELKEMFEKNPRPNLENFLLIEEITTFFYNKENEDKVFTTKELLKMIDFALG